MIRKKEKSIVDMVLKDFYTHELHQWTLTKKSERILLSVLDENWQICGFLLDSKI
jgi:hypothetical protein